MASIVITTYHAWESNLAKKRQVETTIHSYKHMSLSTQLLRSI